MMQPQTPIQIRIAVVEDDVDLREGILVPELTDQGFAVTGVGSAGELYRRLLTEHYDLIVLDVGLPDESGFDVARYLRTTSKVGIIMLTGRSEVPDRVRGLVDGADAYLAKPVATELLVATIRSLQRRSELSRVADAPRPWRIQPDGWQLLAPNGRVVELNSSERSIVQALLDAAGQPVSRATLIANLTDDEYDFDPHRLEMIVHRLRRRAAASTGMELPLRAVRGVGYLFTAADG